MTGLPPPRIGIFLSERTSDAGALPAQTALPETMSSSSHSLTDPSSLQSPNTELVPLERDRSVCRQEGQSDQLGESGIQFREEEGRGLEGKDSLERLLSKALERVLQQPIDLQIRASAPTCHMVTALPSTSTIASPTKSTITAPPTTVSSALADSVTSDTVALPVPGNPELGTIATSPAESVALSANSNSAIDADGVITDDAAIVDHPTDSISVTTADVEAEATIATHVTTDCLEITPTTTATVAAQATPNNPSTDPDDDTTVTDCDEDTAIILTDGARCDGLSAAVTTIANTAAPTASSVVSSTAAVLGTNGSTPELQRYLNQLHHLLSTFSLYGI